MKMTKIESARIIVKNEGACNTVSCKYCFMGDGVCGFVSSRPEKIKFAEAYIKRHESKSKKKDHIEDKLEKVKSTAVSYEPCVSCRNNHGLCSTKERTANVKNCVSYEPIDIENSYFKKKVEEPKQVGIDNSDVTLVLTAQHEPTVKENLSVPQPVKFEDEVPFNLYTVTEHGIFRFTALRFHSEKTKEKDGTTITKEKVFAFEGDRKFDGTKKEVTIDINNCYKTPEEALQVAKKLWNGDGK